jgi:hypothetical protein
MCLSSLVEDPDREIETTVIDGFECTITHDWGGRRCGYLKLEPGHPWHGVHYNAIDASVHGGLTFAEADTPCTKVGADNGWWLGFDCGHSFDAVDLTLPFRGDPTMFNFLLPSGPRQIRTTEYVRNELRELAAQAAAAKLGGADQKLGS